MSFESLATEILAISPTRVWRTYFGGRELEKWLGAAEPRDGDAPEAWVASTVRSRNPNPGTADEGLSLVRLADGTTVTLEEVIRSNPAAFLGAGHWAKYGSNPGVLVKIIDSLNRLIIQVHPDKNFAKSVFASDYGKTEAWYILGGRSTAAEAPYVLLGFKPGVTRQQWERLFAAQDVAGMIDCLHKIPVQPGEVYYIAGGVPHAIGAGCFLVEIQEPTDYTIRMERQTPEGKPLPDILIHQGAGFDKMLDCFSYETATLAETLRQWRVAPREAARAPGGTETVLLGEERTRLFGMNRVSVSGEFPTDPAPFFTIAVVVAGKGQARYQGGSLAIKSGDLFFVPASLGPIHWQAAPGESLEILRCFPPR